MGAHVCRQAIVARKRKHACLAGVWLLPRMGGVCLHFAGVKNNLWHLNGVIYYVIDPITIPEPVGAKGIAVFFFYGSKRFFYVFSSTVMEWSHCFGIGSI